jgi:hypothetical protein
VRNIDHMAPYLLFFNLDRKGHTGTRPIASGSLLFCE